MPSSMTTYGVSTNRYEIDLHALLVRRLVQCGCVYGMMDAGETIEITVQEGEQTKRLAKALALLLSRDLMQLELARYVDGLPIHLSEKQTVLTGTLQQMRSGQEPERIAMQMEAYLAQTKRLNVEGYLLFRMRERLNYWQDQALHGANELMLRREYTELMGVLHTFVENQHPGIGELSICLNPDGSCTLTDDSDGRIEYVDCSEDGIISLLVGMAPTFLTVYDLTGGTGRKLTDAIRRVFAGRVKIFR